MPNLVSFRVLRNKLSTYGLSMGFATKFVQIDVELQETGVALRHQIETQLRSHGESLRWAITSIEGRIAHIEAVVTVVPPVPSSRQP